MEKKPEEMTEEGRLAFMEYKRKWQRANPDKCRQYRIRYWNKIAKNACKGSDKDKSKETKNTEE